MAITGAIMYLASEPLASIFTISSEVAHNSAEMLRLIAFVEPFFGVMIIMQGIYYGLGQNKYPMIIEITSMWGVRVLFTYLVVNVWHLGLREVWYCMIADILFKMLFFSLPILIRKSRERFYNISVM
jgi:Na+-driven multidrug efflux pump